MGSGQRGPISYTGCLPTKFSPKTSQRLESQELRNAFFSITQRHRNIFGLIESILMPGSTY